MQLGKDASSIKKNIKAFISKWNLKLFDENER